MIEIYGVWDAGTTTSASWEPKEYASTPRHLWTDAFGVCNFLSLFYETGEGQYLEQADALVRSVHETLAFKRGSKTEWLNGASIAKPTAGGLRVGDPVEISDGQEFQHSLKWMFALRCMSVATGETKYLEWAIQLAIGIFPSFVSNVDGDRPTVAPKLSTDLQPLNSHHATSETSLDPFEGYVVYKLLQNAAKSLFSGSELYEKLGECVSVFHRIVTVKITQSRTMFMMNDALELGMCLWVSHWFPEEEWSGILAAKCHTQLNRMWTKSGYFKGPLQRRQAYREFGGMLGLQVHPSTDKNWLGGAPVPDLHTTTKAAEATEEQIPTQDKDKTETDDQKADKVEGGEEQSEQTGDQEHNDQQQEEGKAEDSNIEEEQQPEKADSTKALQQPQEGDVSPESDQSVEDPAKGEQPVASNSWIDQVHEYWRQHLHVRDHDITPVMFCTSLLPGVWGSDYVSAKRREQQEQDVARATNDEL